MTMPRALDITGEYPADWKAISDATWAAAGHRCIRCRHPYKKGEHDKGQWTPCDSLCSHRDPLGVFKGIQFGYEVFEPVVVHHVAAEAGKRVLRGEVLFAQWRIGTVHHLDGDKSNCRWWNLLALCQRCHLTIQARVNPHQPYMLEHADWFKPYVAAFYAFKYEGRDITRQEAVDDLDRLLAYERVA